MEARDTPLTDADVQRIVEHMNDEHAEAVRLYAQVYGDFPSDATVDDAVLVSLDADGMRLRVTTDNATQDLRIAFERTIQTPDDAHRLLVEMAVAAREVAGTE